MSTVEEQLVAVVATELERMKRLAAIGDRGTSGPVENPTHAQIITMPTPTPAFVDGIWRNARHVPAHPGRMGGFITSWSSVVHCTDMVREDWGALVKHWSEMPGDGACANMLIGPDVDHGVIQFIPLGRNGNHAGGPQHGVYQDATGRQYHPNSVSFGIELMCAGCVHRINGEWRFVEDNKVHGAAIPDSEVIPDPLRPGRGWHRVTDYQYDMLGQLLTELDAAQPAMPTGVVVRSLYEAPAPWSKLRGARVTGHHNLDARNRDDPHLPTYNWLRARGC